MQDYLALVRISLDMDTLCYATLRYATLRYATLRLLAPYVVSGPYTRELPTICVCYFFYVFLLYKY